MCSDRLYRAALLAGLAVLVSAPPAVAQLRIVTYNSNSVSSGQSLPRTGVAEVLEALGDQAKAGFARPLDILVLQEQSTLATTTDGFVDLLNSIYGAGTYARGLLQGSTTGGGRPAVVYNTETVHLVAESQASTASSRGGPRATLRYEFRPVGYDSAADFYVYASHLKAVDDSASADRRGIEAAEIRADADALGEGSLAIYAGDLNFYRASEIGFQTLLASGPGQAFDPLNRIGSWTNSNAYRDVHTQSPVTTASFPGQVTGGLDDRFDFQLVTGELLDGRGFDVIPGSYWALGNTGTHSLNGPLSSGSVSALRAYLPGYTSQQAAGVIDALMTASDHLPVVADYRLPAKMNVVPTSLPAVVLRDAVIGGSLAISNAAPVAVAAGADSLAYVIAGSGGVVASGSGNRSPLSAAATHPFAYDTSVAGLRSGNVTVTSSSPQAAGASFQKSYTVQVVDRGLLAATGGTGGDGLISLSNAAPQAGTQRATAAIVARSLVGDAGWSVRGLAVGETIAAGGTVTGRAEFDPTGRLNGPATASFQLGFEHADQTLPGAVADDLGTFSWTLETTVAGRTGSGSAVVAAGASLAGLGLDSEATHRSRAILEGGEATLLRTVTMAFESPPLGGLFASDVLTLTGTGGDAVVLSLTYDPAILGGAAATEYCLGWLDQRPESPTATEWVNAIAGNTSNDVAPSEPFVGSWTTYAEAFGVLSATEAVGAWGIDVGTNQAWAVIDHASQFAVIPRVSDPQTGDANLDGQVDVFDLILVTSGGKYGTGLASVWSEGDFNADGVTNVFDLVAVNVAGAYGQGQAGGVVAAVPEPASLLSGAVLAGGLAGGLARRRRRQAARPVTIWG